MDEWTNAFTQPPLNTSQSAVLQSLVRTDWLSLFCSASIIANKAPYKMSEDFCHSYTYPKFLYIFFAILCKQA